MAEWQGAKISINSLIIVCCHGIYLGLSSQNPPPLPTSTSTSTDYIVEENWLLSPFQTSESATFIEHISLGLSMLATDKNTMLVFSGGQTKPSLTPLSEATSYLNYAMTYFPLSEDVKSRIFTDDFASDSFQNVLFPLLQFPLFLAQFHHHSELNTLSRFPEHLTVISHGFKRARFETLHLPALKHPTSTSRFRYVGNAPLLSPEKLAETVAGETAFGFGAWKGDLYGAGEVLRRKRVSRGWDEKRRLEFLETVVGRLEDGERELMNELVNWTGRIQLDSEDRSSQIFPKQLPWE